MDGHIMRCGTIGSCQSVATSQIVKRAAGRESDSCKQCYNKCPDLYIFTFNVLNSTYQLRRQKNYDDMMTTYGGIEICILLLLLLLLKQETIIYMTSSVSDPNTGVTSFSTLIFDDVNDQKRSTSITYRHWIGDSARTAVGDRKSAARWKSLPAVRGCWRFKAQWITGHHG